MHGPDDKNQQILRFVPVVKSGQLRANTKKSMASRMQVLDDNDPIFICMCFCFSKTRMSVGVCAENYYLKD